MDVKVGMPARSGDGKRMGHVEAVEPGGVRISGGVVAGWADVIEVRDGAVWIATHRPELEELRGKSPRT